MCILAVVVKHMFVDAELLLRQCLKDGDDLLDHNGMACLFHNMGYALCAQVKNVRG